MNASPLCAKVGLSLNEQPSAGLHAALHPAGISLEINGVAAAWEACRRGPFDPAHTPLGIDPPSGARAERRFYLDPT